MIINRRGFLAAFAALAIADPERLLWVRGAKFISITKPLLPGVVVSIPCPGGYYSRIPEILRKIDTIRGNRQIMEGFNGQKMFSCVDQFGRLTSTVMVFLAPEGADPKQQHGYMGFKQITLDAAERS